MGMGARRVRKAVLMAELAVSAREWGPGVDRRTQAHQGERCFCAKVFLGLALVEAQFVQL